MGVEMVLIFLSAILLISGLILVFNAGDMGGRKAGFVMLMIGIFGIFISIAAYPRDRNYIPAFEYSNEATTDYNDK